MEEVKIKRVTCLKLGQLGRLGNQLFQVAGTIGFAKKYGADYIFRKWYYNKFLENPIPTSLFVKLRHWENYKPHAKGSKIPLDKTNVTLHAWFMSEKNFKHCEKDIRHYFTLKTHWLDYVKNKYPQLNGNTCAIHVRRGDKLELIDKYPLQPLSYYEDAAKILYGENLKDINFVICSDDIEWCIENFKFPLMTFVKNENDIIDMFIMSMCRDNIISNSTFSWWSAWLNQNPNRVVTPMHWFTPNDYRTGEKLYVDNWIRL
ncbi:MAG: alpha-1,2-fucosyltransferase [Nitrospinales bacterium]